MFSVSSSSVDIGRQWNTNSPTVYTLPLFLLPGMRKEHKAAIYFTFSLGIIPALTCMIRFITLNTDSSEPNLVYILSMVEMATAIAAVSVPGLKPLLDRRAGAGLEESRSEGERESVEGECVFAGKQQQSGEV